MCTNLAPEFEAAASELDGLIKFGGINSKTDPWKAGREKYNIDTYPALRLFGIDKTVPPLEITTEDFTAKELVELMKEFKTEQ